MADVTTSSIQSSLVDKSSHAMKNTRMLPNPPGSPVPSPPPAPPVTLLWATHSSHHCCCNQMVLKLEVMGIGERGGEEEGEEER